MMVCGVRDCIKLVNNLISLLSQLTEVQYLDFILDPDRKKDNWHLTQHTVRQKLCCDWKAWCSKKFQKNSHSLSQKV